MPAVLTKASTVQCQHQGVVTFESQDSLMVAGEKVLVLGELTKVKIDCPQPPQTRCLTLNAVAEGVSTRLKVGGLAVLLATARGTTNAGTWNVTSAGPMKLEAT